MSGMSGRPNISAIVLSEARANRDYEVEFEAPGRAHVEVDTDPPQYDDESVSVVSRCRVTLATEDKEQVAEIFSELLVIFSPVADEYVKDPGLLRSYAMEVAHSHHRQIIIELSERFDIPTFRLDFSLDLDDVVVEDAEVSQDLPRAAV